MNSVVIRRKLMILIQLIMFIFAVWSVVVFVSALIPKRITRSAKHFHPEQIVVLVPAHNEEKVIGRLIENVTSNINGYPVRLIICADRCTDNTVPICKRNDVEVFERKTGLPGKQYLLKDVFASLTKEYGSNPNVIVTILDADNKIEPDYFEQLVDSLQEDDVVQGYIATLNSSDNLQTRWYAMNYHFMLRYYYSGRERLNRSSILGGTGWGFRLSILERVPFDVTSVTDDLEYSAMLRLAKIRVKYNPLMRIYDEKPQSVRVGIRQRTRWARGQWQVFFQYFPKLVFKDFEFCMYLALPLFMLIGLFGFWFNNNAILNLIFSILFILFWMAMDRGLSELPGLLLHIPYLIIQNVIMVYALFTFKNNSWVRTPHGTAKVKYGEKVKPVSLD